MYRPDKPSVQVQGSPNGGLALLFDPVEGDDHDEPVTPYEESDPEITAIVIEDLMSKSSVE